MSSYRLARLLIAGAIALALSACGGAETPPPTEVGLADPSAAEAAPAATSTPEPVTHLATPAEFKYTSLQRIYDCHTGRRAIQGGPLAVNPACDTWPVSDLERPMDAQGGTYVPLVDILMVEFGEDSEWYYARIYASPVDGTDPAERFYALELDIDLDGVGELLLTAVNPSSGDWDVTGVQVWRDDNGDVAGDALGQSPTSGDGYEVRLFDQGVGEDPDLAWARTQVLDMPVVELGFKKSLLVSTPFAWWAWASSSPLEPSQFEVVDRADPATAYQVDNTCSWTYGKSTVAPPNACPAIADALPTAAPSGAACVPPPGGCEAVYGVGSGYIWYNCACVLFN